MSLYTSSVTPHKLRIPLEQLVARKPCFGERKWASLDSSLQSRSSFQANHLGTSSVTKKTVGPSLCRNKLSVSDLSNHIPSGAGAVQDCHLPSAVLVSRLSVVYEEACKLLHCSILLLFRNNEAGHSDGKWSFCIRYCLTVSYQSSSSHSRVLKVRT